MGTDGHAPVTSEAGTTPRRDAIIVAAAVVLVHCVALWRGFIWDDRFSIQSFMLEGRWNVLSPDPFGFVRPGKTALLSLLHAILGERPWAWELVALCVAAASSLCVLRLGRLFLSPAAALGAALLYGVSAMHVEATFWMSALNGSVSVLFCLCGYLVLLSKRSEGPRLALALALFAAAFVMKEDAIVAPVIGLALLWMRDRLRPRTAFFAAAAVLVAVEAAFALWARSVSVEVGQRLWMPFTPLTAVMQWPANNFYHALYFFVPYQWMSYAEAPWLVGQQRAWVALGVAAMLGLAAVAARVKSAPGRLACLLALLALLAHLPTSNLISFGNDPFGVRYLAHMGVFLALAAGALVDAAGAAGRRLAGAALVLLIAFNVGASLRYHQFWKSEDAFFAKVMTGSDRFIFPLQLARIHLEAGRTAEAREMALETIRRKGDHVDAHIILGQISIKEGRPDDALEHWRTAEEKVPLSPDLAANLGDFFDQSFQRTGSPEDRAEAIRYYGIAKMARGSSAEVAFLNHGFILAMEGNPAGALEIWLDGAARFPGSLELRNNIAIAQRELGAGR